MSTPRRLLLSTRIPTLQARTEKIGVQVIEHADVDGSMLITSAAGTVRVYFPEESQGVDARCAGCAWRYTIAALDVSGGAMDAMLGQILDHLAAHVAALPYYGGPMDTKPITTQPVNEKILARLENDYTYHAPKGDQVERYAMLRAKAKDLAVLIVGLTPPSREQSLALTLLEQAVMSANAAIARNE